MVAPCIKALVLSTPPPATYPSRRSLRGLLRMRALARADERKAGASCHINMLKIPCICENSLEPQVGEAEIWTTSTVPAASASGRREVLRKSHTSSSLYAGHDVVEILTKCRAHHLSRGHLRVDAGRAWSNRATGSALARKRAFRSTLSQARH
jgi:hypothetical protein